MINEILCQIEETLASGRSRGLRRVITLLKKYSEAWEKLPDDEKEKINQDEKEKIKNITDALWGQNKTFGALAFYLLKRKNSEKQIEELKTEKEGPTKENYERSEIQKALKNESSFCKNKKPAEPYDITRYHHLEKRLKKEGIEKSDWEAFSYKEKYELLDKLIEKEEENYKATISKMQEKDGLLNILVSVMDKDQAKAALESYYEAEAKADGQKIVTKYMGKYIGFGFLYTIGRRDLAKEQTLLYQSLFSLLRILPEEILPDVQFQIRKQKIKYASCPKDIDRYILYLLNEDKKVNILKDILHQLDFSSFDTEDKIQIFNNIKNEQIEKYIQTTSDIRLLETYEEILCSRTDRNIKNINWANVEQKYYNNNLISRYASLLLFIKKLTQDIENEKLDEESIKKIQWPEPAFCANEYYEALFYETVSLFDLIAAKFPNEFFYVLKGMKTENGMSRNVFAYSENYGLNKGLYGFVQKNKIETKFDFSSLTDTCKNAGHFIYIYFNTHFRLLFDIKELVNIIEATVRTWQTKGTDNDHPRMFLPENVYKTYGDSIAKLFSAYPFECKLVSIIKYTNNMYAAEPICLRHKYSYRDKSIKNIVESAETEETQKKEALLA